MYLTDPRQILAMAVLNRNIKTFIVQALACFDSPSHVAKAVLHEFGIAVSRQQIEIHDPTKRCSKGLARRWVILFTDTRCAFLKAIANIPIASRSYRLRALGRMLEEVERRGNLVLAAKLLEQAAKDVGASSADNRAEGAATVIEVAHQEVQQA
jgi:hypothetical protein